MTLLLDNITTSATTASWPRPSPIVKRVSSKTTGNLLTKRSQKCVSCLKTRSYSSLSDSSLKCLLCALHLLKKRAAIMTYAYSQDLEIELSELLFPKKSTTVAEYMDYLYYGWFIPYLLTFITAIVVLRKLGKFIFKDFRMWKSTSMKTKTAVKRVDDVSRSDIQDKHKLLLKRCVSSSEVSVSKLPDATSHTTHILKPGSKPLTTTGKTPHGKSTTKDKETAGAKCTQVKSFMSCISDKCKPDVKTRKRKNSTNKKPDVASAEVLSAHRVHPTSGKVNLLSGELARKAKLVNVETKGKEKTAVVERDEPRFKEMDLELTGLPLCVHKGNLKGYSEKAKGIQTEGRGILRELKGYPNEMRSIFSKTRSKRPAKRVKGVTGPSTHDITSFCKLVSEHAGDKSILQEMMPPGLNTVDIKQAPPSIDIKTITKKSGKRKKVLTSVGASTTEVSITKVVTAVGAPSKDVSIKNGNRLGNEAIAVKVPLAIEKKDSTRKSKSDKTCANGPSTAVGTDKSKSDKSETARNVDVPKPVVDPRDAVRKEEAMFRLYKYFGENDFAACRRDTASFSSRRISEFTNKPVPFSRTLSTKSHEQIHMVESLYALNEECVSTRGKVSTRRGDRVVSPNMKSISPKSCKAREKLILESPREHSPCSHGTRTSATDHFDTNSGITIIASDKRERINIDNWARGTPSAIEWSRVNETLKTMSGKSLDGGRSRKKSHPRKTTCSSTEFHPELEKFILESENPIKTTLLLCNSGITTKYEQLNSVEPRGIGSVMSRKKRPKSEVFPTLSSFLNHIEQEEKRRLELKESSPKRCDVQTKDEPSQDVADTEKPDSNHQENDAPKSVAVAPNTLPLEKECNLKETSKTLTKFHFGLPPLSHYHNQNLKCPLEKSTPTSIPPPVPLSTPMKMTSHFIKPLSDAPLFARLKRKPANVRAPETIERTEAANNKVNRKKLAVKFDVRNWKKGVLKNMKRDLDAKVMKKKNPNSESTAQEKIQPTSDAKTMDLDIDSIVPPIRIRNGATGRNYEAPRASQSEKAGEQEQKKSIESDKWIGSNVHERSQKESTLRDMCSLRQGKTLDQIFEQTKLKNDAQKKTAIDLGRALKKRGFPDFYKNDLEVHEPLVVASTPQEAMKSSGHTIKKFEDVFLAIDKSFGQKKSLSPPRRICTEYVCKVSTSANQHEPTVEPTADKRRKTNNDHLLTGHRLDYDIQSKQLKADVNVAAPPNKDADVLSPEKTKRFNESAAPHSKSGRQLTGEAARREDLPAHEDGRDGADVSGLDSPGKIVKKNVPVNVSSGSGDLSAPVKSCSPLSPKLMPHPKRNAPNAPETQRPETEHLNQRETNFKKNNETQTRACLVLDGAEANVASKSPPKVVLRTASYTQERTGRPESLTPSPDITSLLQRSKMILKQARVKKVTGEKLAFQKEGIETPPEANKSPRRVVSSGDKHEKMSPSERKPHTPSPVISTAVIKPDDNSAKVKDNPVSPASWDIDAKTNESLATNPSKKSTIQILSVVGEKAVGPDGAKKDLQDHQKNLRVHRSKISGKFQRNVLASKTAGSLNKSVSGMNESNIPVRSSKSLLRRRQSVISLGRNNETSRRTTIKGSPAYVYSRLTSLAQYDLLNEQKNVKYVLESKESGTVKKTVLPKGPKLCTALRARGRELESIKRACKRKISSYDDIRHGLRSKRSLEVAVSQSEKKFPQQVLESKSFTKLCIKPFGAPTSFAKITADVKRHREIPDLQQLMSRDLSKRNPEVREEKNALRPMKDLAVTRRPRHKLNLCRRRHISCTSLMKISSEAALPSQIVCVLKRPEMRPSSTSELRGMSKSAGYSQDTFCEIADGQFFSDVIKDKTSPSGFSRDSSRGPDHRPLPSEGSIRASQAASNLHEGFDKPQRHSINRFMSEDTVTRKTSDQADQKASLTRLNTRKLKDIQKNVSTNPSSYNERTPSKANSVETRRAKNTIRTAAYNPSVKSSHSMTTFNRKEKATDKSQRSAPVLKSVSAKIAKVADNVYYPRAVGPREGLVTREVQPKEKITIRKEKTPEIKDPRPQSTFLATLKKSPPAFRAKTPECLNVKKPVMESIKELQEQHSESMSSDKKSLPPIQTKERDFSELSDARSPPVTPKKDTVSRSDAEETPKPVVDVKSHQNINPRDSDVGLTMSKNNLFAGDGELGTRELQQLDVKPGHGVQGVSPGTGNCPDKERLMNFADTELFQDSDQHRKELQDAVGAAENINKHVEVKSETHSSYLQPRESLPDDTNRSVGSESLLSERLSKGKQNKSFDEISEGRSSVEKFNGQKNAASGKATVCKGEHDHVDNNRGLSALVDVIAIGLLQESMKSVNPMKSPDKTCGHQSATQEVAHANDREGETGTSAKLASVTYNRVKQNGEHGLESESPTSGYSTMKADHLSGVHQSSTGDEKHTALSRGYISPSILKDLLGNTIEEAINAAVGMFTESHGHQIRQTAIQESSESQPPAPQPSDSSTEKYSTESCAKQVRFCNVQPFEIRVMDVVNSHQEAVVEDVKSCIGNQNKKPHEVSEQEMSFIRHENNLRMITVSNTECNQMSVLKLESSEHNSTSVTFTSQDQQSEPGTRQLDNFQTTHLNTSQSRVSSHENSNQSKVSSHVNIGQSKTGSHINNSPSKLFSDPISQAEDTSVSHIHSETFQTFNLMSLPDQTSSADAGRVKTQLNEKSPTSHVLLKGPSVRKPELAAEAQPETTLKQALLINSDSFQADAGGDVAQQVVLVKSSLQRLLFTAELCPPDVLPDLPEKISPRATVATQGIPNDSSENKEEATREMERLNHVNTLGDSIASDDASKLKTKDTEEKLKTKVEGSHSQSEVPNEHENTDESVSEHAKFTRTRKRTFVASCPSILGKVPKITRPESESRAKTKNILKELARKLISKRAMDEQSRLSAKSRHTSGRLTSHKVNVANKADVRDLVRKLQESKHDGESPPENDTQADDEAQQDKICSVVDEIIQRRLKCSRKTDAVNVKRTAKSNSPHRVPKVKKENGLKKTQEMSSLVENGEEAACEQSKEDLEAILNSELTKIDAHTDGSIQTTAKRLFSKGGDKLVRGGRRIRKASSLTISPLMSRNSRENSGPTTKTSYASMMSSQSTKSTSDSRTTKLEDFLQKMDAAVVSRGPTSIISRSSKLSSITSVTKSSEEDEQLQALLEKPVSTRRKSSQRTKPLLDLEMANREPDQESQQLKCEQKKPQNGNDLDLRSWNANNDNFGTATKRSNGNGGNVNSELTVGAEDGADLRAAKSLDKTLNPKKRGTTQDKEPKGVSHAPGDKKAKEKESAFDLSTKISEMFLTQSAIDTINAENENTFHQDSRQEPGDPKHSSRSSGSSSSIVLSWIGSDTLEGDDIFINAESLSMDSKSVSHVARPDVTATARDKFAPPGRDISEVDIQDISEILNENGFDLSNGENSSFQEYVGAKWRSRIPTKSKVARSMGGADDLSLSDLSTFSPIEPVSRPNISNSARKVSAVSSGDCKTKINRNGGVKSMFRPEEVASNRLKRSNVDPVSTVSPVPNYLPRFSTPSSFRGDDSCGYNTLEPLSSDNENETQHSFYSNNASANTLEQQSYFDSFLKDPKWNQPFHLPEHEESEPVNRHGSFGSDFAKPVLSQGKGSSSINDSSTTKDSGLSKFRDRQIKNPLSRDTLVGTGQLNGGTKYRTPTERKRPPSEEHDRRRVKTPPRRGDVRPRTGRTYKDTRACDDRSLAESQKTQSKSSLDSRSRYSGDGKFDRRRYPLSSIGNVQALSSAAAKTHTGAMTLEQHLQSTSKSSSQRSKGNKSLEMHLSTKAASQRNAESISCAANRESKTETAKSTSSQASFNWYKPQSVPSSTSVSNSQQCPQESARPSTRRVESTSANRESGNARLRMTTNPTRTTTDPTRTTENRNCTPTGSNTTNTDNFSSANSSNSQVGRPRAGRNQTQPIADNPPRTDERLPATNAGTQRQCGEFRLSRSHVFTAPPPSTALNKSSSRQSSEIGPKKVSTIVRMFEQKKDG